MTVPVVALWSVARSRSTAFLRSMIERGDLLVLHEPLEHLAYVGPIDVEGTSFRTPSELLDWLVDEPHRRDVFIKETINRPVLDLVHANHRFLAEVRHTFLIRDPAEVAASWWALEHDMRLDDAGFEALHGLWAAVDDAGQHRPVGVDAGDLVDDPAATMRRFCGAVGLPFRAEALSWTPGVRPEWFGTERWHVDVSASTGFARPAHPDRTPVAAVPEVRRFVERHRPFYELLRAERWASYRSDGQ